MRLAALGAGSNAVISTERLVSTPMDVFQREMDRALRELHRGIEEQQQAWVGLALELTAEDYRDRVRCGFLPELRIQQWTTSGWETNLVATADPILVWCDLP